MSDVAASSANRLQDHEIVCRGQCCLIKIYPPGGGLWPLDDQPAQMGRGLDCQIDLEDDSISRRHAVIQSTEDGYVITDLESTNGLIVNDSVVQQQQLQAGDLIRVGNHILKFLSDDRTEAQYHETIYNMMTTDGLTAAYNRRYFLEALDRELVRALRHGRPLTLLMIDIDHFRSLNETYGNLAGDEVLLEFARRIRRLLRRDEIFARYGGEEFALVISEVDLDDAIRLGEQIRRIVEQQPFSTTSALIDITVSVGITQTRGEEPMTPSQMLDRADDKLFEAKESGRNRVNG